MSLNWVQLLLFLIVSVYLKPTGIYLDCHPWQNPDRLTPRVPDTQLLWAVDVWGKTLKI